MYKKLIENLSYGIMLLDENMRVKYVNKYVEDILKNGCSNPNYMGKICGNAFSCINTLEDDINCGDGKECSRCDLRQSLVAIKEKKIGQDEESKLFRIIRGHGEIIRFRLKGYRMNLEGENSIVIEIQNAEKEENLINISEKVDIWNRKLERVLDNLQDQVCVVDENLNYIYVNNALSHAVGKTKEEIIGKSDYHLVSGEMAELCRENSRYALENGNFSREEYVEGKYYHILKGRVEISKGKYGVFGIIKNITEERKKENIFHRKIYIDSLTGLYNRNFYEEKLENLFQDARRDEDEFSILVIDVDNFKGVNDTYGHHSGDRILQELAEIIKKNIRKKDYAVRIGGDEIILTLNANTEIAGQIGNRIIQEVNEMDIEGIKISISIGISTRDQRLKTFKELYVSADKAMYESKKQGKNTLSYYN